jgi:predicted transcriptional regulator
MSVQEHWVLAASTNVTFRVSPDVKEKLDRIAAGTRRSKSFLAGEAVAAYVDRELEIIEGIKRGMADAEADRVVPHDEAMAEIYAVIDTAEAKRSRKT